MHEIAQAFNSAMQESGGKLKVAAHLLAERLEDDEWVRCEAGALLIALLVQPGFAEHDRIFRLDVGKSIDEWVQANRATPSDVAQARGHFEDQDIRDVLRDFNVQLNLVMAKVNEARTAVAPWLEEDEEEEEPSIFEEES